MALHQTIRDALPIRLGDRKYNIDLARFARATIDPIRQGFDTQGTPGEQTLNQAGVWKRTRTDWEFGAGQREADMLESEQRKFNTSTGINPWVKGELSLMNLTVHQTAISTDNQYMAQANDGTNEYLYVCDGANVRYSTNQGHDWADGTPTAPITNPAGGTITGIASDGTNVYVASAANDKVQQITGFGAGVTEDTHWWTVADTASNGPDGIWVANGYLITSIGSRLTVLSVASAPSTGADITSESFSQIDKWTSVIGTPTGIYAAGNKGDRGRIYHVGISDSTGALKAPVIAAELPHGETINVLSEYSGLLCIGTSKGVRLAQMSLVTGNSFGGSASGFIQYGPRININNGVQVFDAQGEFIWFGWEDYDSPFDTTDRSGLGRLSLKELTGPLTPAYASDLMTPAAITLSGAVRGVVTATYPVGHARAGQEIRLFSVGGSGVWQETATFETTGSIDEGRFRWGTTELKAAVSVDMRHGKLLTSESIRITVIDDTGGDYYTDSELVGSYTPGIKAVQVSSQKDPTDYGLTASDLQYVSTVSSVTGEYITPTIKLNGPGTSTPTLYRWTVRAVPMPFVAEVIQLPIILTTQTRHDNRDIYQDTYDDYQYVRSLLEDRSLVTFEMGDESRTVHVSGVGYEAGSINKWSDDNGWLEGVLTVTIITVQGG
jgi:hypothetical protein